jgi:hypothetical protein
MFEFIPRCVVQLFDFAVIAYSGFLIALAMVVSFMWVASSSHNNNNKNNNNNNIPNSSANNRRRDRQRKTQQQQGDRQQKRIFSLLILIMFSKINLNIKRDILARFSVTSFVHESAPVYWYLSKSLRGLIRAPITRRKSL